ncbi:MAG: hypothetical protein HYV20_16000 [Gemmatimonadetes bacterium]|nr:hypothetical protein [Gemmatimonadota bacterium]
MVFTPFHPNKEVSTMSRFSRIEPEIAALTLLLKEGLAQAPNDLPAPPEIQAKLDA